MDAGPPDRHARPADVDDATIAAVGRCTEAFEWIVRARGRLYDVHQMIGRADGILGDAVEALERAGHAELAHGMRTELLGRNVIPGHWTYELVESFDATYYDVAAEWERRVRDALVEGRRHVAEAEMKAERRLDGPTDDR